MSAIRGNKSEIANQNRLIVKEVKGEMAARGIIVPTMARRMGMSERNFYRAMNDPGRMTLTELRKLAAELGWTAETGWRVLFGR